MTAHQPTPRLVAVAWATLSFAAVLCAEVANAETIAWRSDFETARAESAATGRPLLLHFGATWCGPCRAVERTVFTDPNVMTAVNSQFVPVKVDVDQHPELVAQFSVGPIPADLVVAPNGSVVGRESGFRPAAVYVASLERAKTYYGQGVVATGTTMAGAAVPTMPALGINQAPGVGLALGTNDAVGARPPQQPMGRQPMQLSGGHAPAVVSGVGYQAPTPQMVVPPQQYQFTQPVPQHAPNAPPAFATQPSVQPVGNPPLALDGFCPVSLLEKSQWTPGRPEFGLRHRGRTYLFAGPDEWQRFNADPDKYAPLASGLDPVLMVDEKLRVDGRRRHGVTYRGQVLLFASEETLDRFSRNPERYASLVRPTGY